MSATDKVAKPIINARLIKNFKRLNFGFIIHSPVGKSIENLELFRWLEDQIKYRCFSLETR